MHTSRYGLWSPSLFNFRIGVCVNSEHGRLELFYRRETPQIPPPGALFVVSATQTLVPVTSKLSTGIELLPQFLAMLGTALPSCQ